MNGKHSCRTTAFSVTLLVTFLASHSFGASWPQWRGPNRNGITSEHSGWNGTSWGIEKRWQVSVGRGMGASPILVNGRVYVMGNVSGKERISCLNVHSNGAVVWYQEYTQGLDPRYREGESPEGPASTPTFDPDTGYLYTLGIDGDVNCWDAGDPNGTNVWHINLYDTYSIDQRNSGCSIDPTRDYGYCGTPLLFGDNVIIEVGDETDGNIMAFNKLTGARAWTSTDKHDAGHNCGPVLMDLGGTPCVVSFTLEGLRVMRADSGHEGENVAWLSWLMPYNVNCPTPAVQGNTVVLTSTSGHSSGKKTTFLQLSLSGGITNQWTGQRQAYICTPLIHEGYVYMIDMMLHCIEFSTGNFVWEGGSLSSDNNGSLVATGDDKIIAWGKNTLILAESAKNSPGKYTELAKVVGAIASGDTRCHPHVALAEGWILVKDKLGRIAGYSVAVPDTTPPSKPGCLSTIPLSASDVDLSWAAASDPDSGISYYNVYRDGVVVGTPGSTNFTDSGLTAGFTYTYRVSAVNGSSLEGPQSDPAQATTFSDIVPPRIASVVAAGSPNEVLVVFDELVDPASAEGAANYAVNHCVSVTGASLGGDLRTVTLTCSSLSEGITYVLTVNGVQDAAMPANTIAADSVSAFEYVPGVVQDGLLAHWPMEEGNGTTTEDAVGGHEGSVNGASWTTDGKYGNALAFDGSDDYVDTGTWSVGGTGLTVALWLKADDFDVADARLASKATGTAEQDHYWMLSTVSSGGTKLRFRLKTGGNTTTLIAGSGNLVAGEWTHAAIVYDGATMKSYKNAVEVASTAKTGPLDTDDSVSVWIGNNPGGGKPFDGIIDDARVYGRALSPSDLAALMEGREYRDVDRDRDGMSDDWEECHFGSTTSAVGDAWADCDGDGLCNFHESQAGTDPTNASSVLALNGAGCDRDDFVLSWHSVSGRFYSIEVLTNLGDRPMVTVSNVAAYPPTNTRTVSVKGAKCRFYRMRLE